jgi:hypothetical protein
MTCLECATPNRAQTCSAATAKSLETKESLVPSVSVGAIAILRCPIGRYVHRSAALAQSSSRRSQGARGSLGDAAALNLVELPAHAANEAQSLREPHSNREAEIGFAGKRHGRSAFVGSAAGRKKEDQSQCLPVNQKS